MRRHTDRAALVHPNEQGGSSTSRHETEKLAERAKDGPVQYQQFEEVLGALHAAGFFQPVCTEILNSDVVVMESAKDGARIDDTGPLNRARDRRILFQ